MLEFEMREVKKKFKAIGYIRHVNLVRVVSFSSDQFDRHGHMPNGYLDKWIFPKINAFITCLEAKKENHH